MLGQPHRLVPVERYLDQGGDYAEQVRAVAGDANRFVHLLSLSVDASEGELVLGAEVLEEEESDDDRGQRIDLARVTTSHLLPRRFLLSRCLGLTRFDAAFLARRRLTASSPANLYDAALRALTVAEYAEEPSGPCG